METIQIFGLLTLGQLALFRNEYKADNGKTVSDFDAIMPLAYTILAFISLILKYV